MTDTPNTYPSLAQAAAALGLSAKTLKRWIDTGKVEAKKRINGSYAVPFSEVERLKAEGDQAR
jgi:predicted site-specific integrase-resolvase